MSKSKPEAFALVLDQPVSQLGLDSGGVDAKEPAVNHVQRQTKHFPSLIRLTLRCRYGNAGY
jgi:hypothetical protein